MESSSRRRRCHWRPSRPARPGSEQRQKSRQMAAASSKVSCWSALSCVVGWPWPGDRLLLATPWARGGDCSHPLVCLSYSYGLKPIGFLFPFHHPCPDICSQPREVSSCTTAVLIRWCFMLPQPRLKHLEGFKRALQIFFCYKFVICQAAEYSVLVTHHIQHGWG